MSMLQIQIWTRTKSFNGSDTHVWWQSLGGGVGRAWSDAALGLKQPVIHTEYLRLGKPVTTGCAVIRARKTFVAEPQRPLVVGDKSF